LIDTMTRNTLKVSTVGTVGPFIRLAYSQLPELQHLLDQHQIRYWVSENVISWNGGPETVVVNLGRSGDAVTVQTILDSAS
jgi:hypothetical protein